MDLGLSGTRVAITGGVGGIGLVIARLFADEGARVAVCGREPERVALAQQTLGRGHIAEVADLVAGAGAWADSVAARLGGVDIVVLAASAVAVGWKPALDVDLTVTRTSVDAFAPHLRQSRCGSLLYIGSKASCYAAPPDWMGYAAVKAAMTHYMKSLSFALAPQVRVNVVSPGSVDIPGGHWDKMKVQEPAFYQATLAKHKLGRLATIDEIATSVVFLASPASSFTTGAHLVIDGGYTEQVHW